MNFIKTPFLVDTSELLIHAFVTEPEKVCNFRVQRFDPFSSYTAMILSTLTNSGTLIEAHRYINQRRGQDLAYRWKTCKQLDKGIFNENFVGDNTILDPNEDILIIFLEQDKRFLNINYKLEKISENNFKLLLPSLEYFEKIFEKIKYKHPFINIQNRDVIEIIKSYL